MKQNNMGNKQKFLHNVLGRKALDVMSGYLGRKASIVLYNNFLVNDVYMKPKDVSTFEHLYNQL